ncbi:malto-oligosyltrehalose synthase [Candidatus Auribacterota bacterium]
MRIPRSTYRVQFNKSFRFEDQSKIVGYLSDMGISDLYASPIFKAKKESSHGYDVVDLTKMNPELGTKQEFIQLAETMSEKEMGWLQDIVPNHMAFDGENDMLMDVLENGTNSLFYEFFDIYWNHPYESIRGRLLAPFLGKFYAECLRDGEIKLAYDANGLSINYYSLKFPIKIESYGKVLLHDLENLEKSLGENSPDFIKYVGTVHLFKPASPKGMPQQRYSNIKYAKKMLWELYQGNKGIHDHMVNTIDDFNGTKGDLESMKLLDDLLSEQLFRLSFWKVANEEINYRRFFNINNLISMRVEDEKVYNGTHSLIFKLIVDGKFTGIRIDHIDGLYNPSVYLNRLRKKFPDLYLVVEKILDYGELLPSSWPVQGTTGYDFMNFCNEVFVNSRNEKKFNAIYSKFAKMQVSYDRLVADKKRLIIGKHMAGNIDNIANRMNKIASKDKYGIDITLYGLKRALVEVMAMFPVYRTYISTDNFSDQDKRYISLAIQKACESNPGLMYELKFIEKFFLYGLENNLNEDDRAEWLKFVMNFQQFTGPLMAKGFEDTIFYIYNRLLSMNEVGGNPGKFGLQLKDFHEFNKNRAKELPDSINATSTHDVKRGEDVRARINVLSEIPRQWEQNIKLWSDINKDHRKMIKGRSFPDKNDEYFLYQTLIGACPMNDNEHDDFCGRVKEYIIKAVREAKVHTAWLKPDIDYEEAYIEFVDNILRKTDQNKFIKKFLSFQKNISYYGMFNSLSQALIKITSPGVPDLYQGSEYWELTLVDPDNRRPVDFDERKETLSGFKKKEKGKMDELLGGLMSNMEDGRIKQFLIYRALNARKKYPELFGKGSYQPLFVGGSKKDSVIAFARSYKDSWSITVVPRFLVSVVKEGEKPLGRKIWGDTFIALPEGVSKLTNDITGKDIAGKDKLLAGDILKDFPAALLIGKS